MGLFSFGNKERKVSSLKWVRLTEASDLDQLIEKESFVKPVVLFKHSTRCSISAMALNRLENEWNIEEELCVPVYLDLIAYRDISNKIASDLQITHQSPQILVVKEGRCVYTSSHSQINVRDIIDAL